MGHGSALPTRAAVEYLTLGHKAKRSLCEVPEQGLGTEDAPSRPCGELEGWSPSGPCGSEAGAAAGTANTQAQPPTTPPRLQGHAALHCPGVRAGTVCPAPHWVASLLPEESGCRACKPELQSGPASQVCACSSGLKALVLVACPAGEGVGRQWGLSRYVPTCLYRSWEPCLVSADTAHRQ